MPNQPKKTIRLSTIALILTLLAILIIPIFIYGTDADFAGSDGEGTSAIADANGYQPWFELNFVPKSAELQSGLFAIQAALGAGVLGYALGAMNERRRNRKVSPAPNSNEQSGITLALSEPTPV